MLRDATQMGIPVDSSTDVAHFKWEHNGISFDEKTNKRNPLPPNKIRAQILNPDGGLYMIPHENQIASVCRYLDFASIRAMPMELSYQKAKMLTEALKVINPRITDVRITNIMNGLSVVLDDNKEMTLGTIGNGAVTWVSTLIAIFELIEQFKIDQQTNIPILFLIDEFGAGIHYSVMNDVWKYIRDFTARYPNIQFITTSHSDDCIRAFCETFTENKNAASIVRLHKAVDGEIVSTLYETNRFNTIMSGEWEVRG